MLVVDGATTAEHLYVGLTRGREHNLACVVREPFDDGHRLQPAPSAHDVLAAALHRSGNEASATEAARAELGSPGYQEVVKAVLAHALRRRQDLSRRPGIATVRAQPAAAPALDPEL